jgi:dihydrofolate reductase
MNKSIEVIYAVNTESILGINGTIPWHIPEDLKRFKNITTGHIVLMGRKTYESIGKPLPNRTNIVVSSTMKQEDYPNLIICSDPMTAINKYKTAEASLSEQKMFIIGGAWLISNIGFIKADKIHVTEVYSKHILPNTNMGKVVYISNNPGNEFELIEKTAILTSSSLLTYCHLTYKRKQNV